MSSALSRAAFFARLRASGLAGPTLSQTEVDGLSAILDAWTRLGWPADPCHVAYTMATAWHECRLDLTIREVGLGRSRPYGVPVAGRVYYGRGAVQLTWIENYRRFGRLLNLDLVGDPDLALVPGTSAAILVLGCRGGLFREGRCLARYFDGDTDDPVGARDIVNGDVRENGPRIAGYHRVFLACLRAALPAGAPDLVQGLTEDPAKDPVKGPDRPAAPAATASGLLGRLVSTVRGNMRKGA